MKMKQCKGSIWIFCRHEQGLDYAIFRCYGLALSWAALGCRAGSSSVQFHGMNLSNRSVHPCRKKNCSLFPPKILDVSKPWMASVILAQVQGMAKKKPMQLSVAHAVPTIFPSTPDGHKTINDNNNHKQQSQG